MTSGQLWMPDGEFVMGSNDHYPDEGQFVAWSLVFGVGRQTGLDATDDVLANGWEHWDRIQGMANPQGYLWAVGRNRIRRTGSRVEEVPLSTTGLGLVLMTVSGSAGIVIIDTGAGGEATELNQILYSPKGEERVSSDLPRRWVM